MEIARSMNDLMTSQSIVGRRDFPDSEMLDGRIASALGRIISNASFRRRVSVEEQRAQKYNRFLRGRQIAKMIYGHFQSTGAYDAAQHLSHLFNIHRIDTRWDMNKKVIQIEQCQAIKN